MNKQRWLVTILIRGYPEPVLTWRREDNQPIMLRDSAGGQTQGERPYEGRNYPNVSEVQVFMRYLTLPDIYVIFVPLYSILLLHLTLQFFNSLPKFC